MLYIVIKVLDERKPASKAKIYDESAEILTGFSFVPSFFCLLRGSTACFFPGVPASLQRRRS